MTWLALNDGASGVGCFVRKEWWERVMVDGMSEWSQEWLDCCCLLMIRNEKGRIHARADG